MSGCSRHPSVEKLLALAGSFEDIFYGVGRWPGRRQGIISCILLKGHVCLFAKSKSKGLSRYVTVLLYV
jgi:hypothetical protein